MIPYLLRQKPAIFALIFLIILLPSLTFADAGKIFKENNKAVVVVVTYDKDGNPISQGSGFIVREDGVVVTNYHVISNAVDIKVKAGDKVLNVEGLIYTDKENDLVILKADAKNFPTVKIGDIEKINIGEKVYVISSPEGLENTISDGILSGIRVIKGTKKRILQITASISSGSSGGPVFNKNGEVIGIATFIIESAQNLNFAMPVNLIKDKVSAEKITALKDSEIEDYKKTAEYWFYIGIAYSKSDMYKEAAEAFKQSLRIKPDDEIILNCLGITYEALGMYSDAIGAYKQAISINRNLVDAHHNLGFTYNKLRKHKEAVEAFKQAIRIKPDDADAHHNLGFTYNELRKHKEAVEAFKQAIRINSDLVEAHDNLGIAYSKLNMYKEAIEAFKQAIRINPDDAAVHYNLGITYLILNNKGAALNEYKILKVLDPDRANTLFNLIYK